jgi:hypothetical protein
MDTEDRNLARLLRDHDAWDALAESHGQVSAVEQRIDDAD